MTTILRPFEDEVLTDGITVWVNRRGIAIGRFSWKGIDVHTEDTTGCLYCIPGPLSRHDFITFQAKMLEHHGILIGDEYCPEGGT